MMKYEQGLAFACYGPALQLANPGSSTLIEVIVADD